MIAALQLFAAAALAGLLAACASDDDTPAGRDPETDHAAESIAPAIIPPDEVADPAQPPSYEVAIATAAAQRNQALERCSRQPEAVRTQCQQEANVSFAEAEAGLQSLRGNQP